MARKKRKKKKEPTNAPTDSSSDSANSNDSGASTDPPPKNTPLEKDSAGDDVTTKESGSADASENAKSVLVLGVKDAGLPADSSGDQPGGLAALGLPSFSRVISVTMLLLGIVAVGALFYKIMVGFFVPLFLAAAFVVIFRPVHEWILQRVGNRPRVAAAATTSVILGLVLVPFFLIISVAWSQFSSLSSRVGEFDTLSDRARGKVGLTLPNADQFRRLNELLEMLDDAENPDLVLDEIDEIQVLMKYLETHVEGAPEADPEIVNAEEELAKFRGFVEKAKEAREEKNRAQMLEMQDEFHAASLAASEQVRNWMHAMLGGPIWSELKLLANPGQSQMADWLRNARAQLQPRFVKLSGDTGLLAAHLAIGLVIMVIAVYFFLIDGPAMVRTLMRLSPLDDAYELRLLSEFERTSRAVVMASLLSALAQGILAGIAFLLAGLDSAMFLLLITTVMALVPFLGAASVWIPCALYLGFVEERWIACVLLTIYGFAVISSIDNVIKAYVLHGHSELHPLLALLSVLGGVGVFGPVGILVGPMIVVFLQTLLEILAHELMETDDEREDAAPESASP